MQERQCLYHFPICPFCREIRFLLELNDVKNCSLRIENFWEKREKFLNINPTGDVPFLAVQKIDENDERKSWPHKGRLFSLTLFKFSAPKNTANKSINTAKCVIFANYIYINKTIAWNFPHDNSLCS